MSTPLNIFIDISADALISSLNNGRQISSLNLPFFYGDTPLVNVYLMTKTPQSGNPASPSTSASFTGVSTAGLSLAMLIDDGLPDTTNIFTQQLTWSTDPNNTYFYATVPLNTAAIKALLGSNRSAPAYLQVSLTENGLPRTVLVQQITITAGVPNVVTSVPAGQTALSAEVALATFIAQDSTIRLGQPIYLSSANGKIIALRAVDQADGSCTFDASPIN